MNPQARRYFLITKEGTKRIVKVNKLYTLPKGLTYKEILPCTRHYNAYNSAYNSRERKGKELFGRIAREYVEMQIEKLVAGDVVTFRGSAPLKMVLIQRNSNSLDVEGRSMAVKLFIWSYNARTLSEYSVMLTNKFKARILANMKAGVVYKKKTKNATKHKILYS